MTIAFTDQEINDVRVTVEQYIANHNISLRFVVMRMLHATAVYKGRYVEVCTRNWHRPGYTTFVNSIINELIEDIDVLVRKHPDIVELVWLPYQHFDNYIRYGKLVIQEKENG